MNKIILGGAFLAAMLAGTAASAQSSPDSWTGFYAGARLGYSWQPKDGDERLAFDTNRDGNFGDVVRTTTGANAFSPGFCGGLALAPTRTAGCDSDSNAVEYTGMLGFDYQLGDHIVAGVVGEYGNSNANDYLSGFSTTPASYSLSRGLRGTGAIRARVGYAADLFGQKAGTLVYATGGGAYGRVRNHFSTSNNANSFTNPDGSDARLNSWHDKVYGYTYGGGVEQRIGRFSIGVLYLYTSLKDNDYRVDVGRGTAPVTNPFLLTNAAGTVIRREFSEFNRHTVSVTTSYRC